jgi:hypothetical protein
MKGETVNYFYKASSENRANFHRDKQVETGVCPGETGTVGMFAATLITIPCSSW